MKDKIVKYLSSKDHFWWTVTLLPGCYAIIYLYLKNYTIVNSWQQLSSFIVCFVLIPSLLFLLLDLLFKRKMPERRAQLYWSFLLINFSIIFSLSIYLGWRWKALILVALLAIAASFFMAKHYKKIVLLLSIMCLVASGQLLFFISSYVLSSEDWVQPMAFESSVFQKKPNVYLLQPDGYVGEQAANNAIYQLNNHSFYDTMKAQGFQFNADFRSNYPTTLASNSTLFTAQHHYLHYGEMNNELMNARDIILGDNPVLNTFVNNGYKTHLILEHSYLLLNYPEVSYDTNNVNRSELSLLLPNYFLGKDYIKDFKNQILRANEDPQFYFVEILHPGHISFTKDREDAIAFEKNKYREEIKSISSQLIDMVQFIELNDPEAIILIVADHGGFVGYTHTGAAYTQPEKDLALKESVFNALYAVKAPVGFDPFQKTVKSSIGVFPALFDYLSGDLAPSISSFDNSSYLLIKSDAKRVLHQYYDTHGNSVMEKVDKP
jgi:hypothetical protein